MHIKFCEHTKSALNSVGILKLFESMEIVSWITKIQMNPVDVIDNDCDF